jgi:hypothetical protein
MDKPETVTTLGTYGTGRRETKHKLIKKKTQIIVHFTIHWGKADDRNGHPRMVDVESGKNLFCRLSCFYNVF